MNLHVSRVLGSKHPNFQSNWERKRVKIREKVLENVDFKSDRCCIVKILHYMYTKGSSRMFGCDLHAYTHKHERTYPRAKTHTHTHTHTFKQVKSQTWNKDWLLRFEYGVATISRLLKIIGLFCKRALWKRVYSAKETYNFNELTDRSHPTPYVIWISQTR